MTVLELSLIAVIVVLIILLVGFWRAEEWRTLDGLWSLTKPEGGLEDAHMLVEAGEVNVLVNRGGDVQTGAGALASRVRWTPWHRSTVRGELTLPNKLLGAKTWSYEKTALGKLTLSGAKAKPLVFVRDVSASLA